MNCVLDDAEELDIKKKERKPLGAGVARSRSCRRRPARPAAAQDEYC